MKKTPNVCYTTLMQQLTSIDKQICQMREQIKQLKRWFVTEAADVCQDEVDADRAAMEAINDICFESLLDIEPKGDA